MKHVNRRTFIKTVGAATAGAAILPRSAWAEPSSRGKRLNVVVMVADDQRHDTIAALGNPFSHTPNLDRIVNSGFAMLRGRCMGSQNPAVCVPTRAMLHTGRTLFHVPENLGTMTTLGEALRAQGYRTFAAGKWHNGTPGFVRSFSGGGNIFFGGMHADQFKMPVRDFDPAGKYPNSAIRTGDKFSSELFADAAIEFIAGHGKQAAAAGPSNGPAAGSSDAPFFCYLAFTSPHDPRTPPTPFSRMYDPAKMPLPKNWLPQHPFDNGELAIRDEKLAPFPRTEADTRKQLCDYYGMISSQDAQVGRVLKTLDDHGLTDHTIIVYTSDHGLAIGSHGLFGKQNIYEHSQRIPMLFSGPGIPRAGTSDALAYGFDIFPTLCDLLGITPPPSMEGKSLSGIFAGRGKAVRESVFGVYDHLINPKNPAQGATAIQRGINDGRWKYHHYDVKGQMTIRLFDLQNDPDEIHDLSQEPAATKELPRLQALLAQWRRDLSDNQMKT